MSEYDSFSTLKLMTQLNLNGFKQQKMTHDIPNNLNLTDFKIKM
jgi:hypothetical protein